MADVSSLLQHIAYGAMPTFSSAFIPRLRAEPLLHGEMPEDGSVCCVALGLVGFAIANGCMLGPWCKQRGGAPSKAHSFSCMLLCVALT